ncbi:alpha/beta hydrolase [Verticiella sediminum]|nr:alpha/beta hydrolase-fold protein [Verticiella sediminum]
MSTFPTAAPHTGPSWQAQPGLAVQTVLTDDAGGAYRISVYAPPGPAPARGWPVLLWLDDEFADLAWALWRHHAQGRKGPVIAPGVLVSVGYPGASRREQDYVPALAGAGGGRADAFRRFLFDDVLPQVAAGWPLDPDTLALGGHSLGGLFVLDTLLRAPERAHAWLAISPSVWWGDGHLARLADSVPAQAHGPVLVYVGEHEQGLSPAEATLAADARERLAAHRGARRMVDGAREFVQALARGEALQPRFTCIAGEGHRSLVPRALDLALRGLYGR